MMESFLTDLVQWIAISVLFYIVVNQEKRMK